MAMSVTFWPIFAAALEEDADLAAREEDEDSISRSAAFECSLSAASEWIIQSGRVLFSLAQSSGTASIPELISVKPGPLYGGRAELRQEQWYF